MIISMKAELATYTSRSNERVKELEKGIGEMVACDKTLKESMEKLIGKPEDQLGVSNCLNRSKDVSKISSAVCGLIIQAERDPNNAFEYPHKTIIQINHLGLTSIFKEISDLRQMKETITILNSNGNRIPLLFLRAHGSPFAMGFGTRDKLRYVFPMNKLLHQSLNMIDPNAVTLLRSCSTGRDSFFPLFPCFARILSYNHPNQTIIAPSRNTMKSDEMTILPERKENSPLGLTFSATNPKHWSFFRGGRKIAHTLH